METEAQRVRLHVPTEGYIPSLAQGFPSLSVSLSWELLKMLVAGIEQ